MNYQAAFQDFFKSPKWTMNMLLGAVCSLIPIAGAMVVMGWLLNGFWGRSDDRAETFPDFSFDNFGKKLERGLWPSLVWIIGCVVIIPVVLVTSVIFALVAGAVFDRSSFLFGIFMNAVFMAVMGVLFFFLLPVVLRAALKQDFSAAFDMAALKRFIGLVKNELVMTALVLAATGFALSLLGYIICLGQLATIAAIPVVSYAWVHLSKQLYTLYVSRGGEPIDVSPKLTDSPEATPPAPSSPSAPAA